MLPRRRLLALTAGLIQACALWPGRSAIAAPLDLEADVLQACLGLFGDRRNAVAVGRRYLALVPEEARRGWLAEQILRSIIKAGDGTSHGTEQAGISKAAVSAAIRSDFTAERVVSLDGWLLARLEARVCALAALAEREPADLS